MRNAILAVLVAALAGCGVELLTTTAITGELQAQNIQAINRNMERATDSTARVNLQRSIDLFSAEKGRLPKSLDELVPAYLQNVPTKPDGSPYGYDPGTGRLLDSPAPAPAAGPTPNDMQKMEQIRAAINSYGTAVGYYPPNLAALAPTYIAAIPKTDSGEDFVFYCENGTLLHPAQARAQQQQAQAQAATPQPRPQASAPMGGGAGPMGEMMTGIGIQNQLNSMSNAGTSAAGTRMREGAADIAGQHNRQQEQAMDKLGL